MQRVSCTIGVSPMNGFAADTCHEPWLAIWTGADGEMLWLQYRENNVPNLTGD
jgi:hypothetical protein